MTRFLVSLTNPEVNQGVEGFFDAETPERALALALETWNLTEDSYPVKDVTPA